MRQQLRLFLTCMVFTVCCSLHAAFAQQQSDDARVVLANGAFSLQAPAEWLRKKPRTRIVEHEFALPAAEGDEVGGRLTIMAAGGSVQANIDRWLGQFVQPDGSRSKNGAQTKEKEITGHKVHFVDVRGTFQDRPRGPFGPAVARADYRMLGAIIETKGKGNHFIKLYGPQKTVKQAEKPFQEFIESLQATQ